MKRKNVLAGKPMMEGIDVPTAPAHIEEIANYLAMFFKDSPHKITYWLVTPNLHFGGTTPSHLINTGRAHKVANFINEAKANNLKLAEK